MNGLSCILAATDFSAAGDRAVRRAALIAKQHHADLHLLHAVHPLDLYPGPGQDVTPPNAELPQVDGARLGELAHVMSEHYGVRTHIAWRIGRAYSRIADYANEVGANLVAVGAQPDTSMLQFLVGSTGSKLLRVHSGPLLIVRSADVIPYQRVLVALDFSPDARAALTWARRIGPQAHLDVLHVVESALDSIISEAVITANVNAPTRDKAQILLGRLLKDVGSHCIAHIENGDPTEHIRGLADRRKSDLIVLGQRGHTGLDEFLYGSVSTAIAQGAECDVLIVKRENNE